MNSWLQRRMIDFRNAYRRYVPSHWRWKIYLLRWLGPFKFIRGGFSISLAKLRVHGTAVNSDGTLWSVPQVGLLNLGNHSTQTLRAHWIEHAQPISEFKAFVRWARGRRTLIDAGAAEGLFSIAFCRMTSGQAFAFEPSPVMLARLRDNLSRNSRLNVSVCDVALGSANSAVIFRQVADGMWVPTKARGAGQVKRPTVALDDWCAANQVRPDLVKVDVEGLELAVLKGARHVLLASRPVVLLEVHPQALFDLRLSIDVLDSLLPQLRYRIETLRGRAIPSLSRYVAKSREDTVAVHVVLAPQS